MKNCDQELENAARGCRPRVALSSPRLQLFIIRTDPKRGNRLTRRLQAIRKRSNERTSELNSHIRQLHLVHQLRGSASKDRAKLEIDPKIKNLKLRQNKAYHTPD